MSFSKKPIVVSLAGLLLIAFLALLGFGLANRSPVTGLSGFTRINKPVPELNAERYNGTRLVLSEHIGQPMVINFWASWCVPCRDEQPILESTWRDYADKDVLFVGVNIQDEEAVGRAYLKEFDVTYPNVKDDKGRATVEFGVIGLPVTFFVNKQGLVERRYVGALNSLQLTGWVEDIIAGVAPTGDTEGENAEGYRSLN